MLALDLDGTLTPIRSSWRYLHVVLGSYLRASRYPALFQEGVITYDEWVYLDLSLWRGVHISTIERILRGVPWRPGSERLKELRRHGVYTLVVSGGLEPLARRAVEELGLDDYIAVVPEVDSLGRLTGFSRSFIDFHGKGDAVLSYVLDKGLDGLPLIAVGDSHNDVELFKVSDYSIAFCPVDSDVASEADRVIDECRVDELIEEVLRFINTTYKSRSMQVYSHPGVSNGI